MSKLFVNTKIPHFVCKGHEHEVYTVRIWDTVLGHTLLIFYRIIILTSQPQHPFDIAIYGDYIFSTAWLLHAILSLRCEVAKLAFDRKAAVHNHHRIFSFCIFLVHLISFHV
uniref:Uncharacterized protein n=1 Tax=Strigamia maritima TaxID=126957 RepID=T1IRA7_STRMM